MDFLYMYPLFCLLLNFLPEQAMITVVIAISKTKEEIGVLSPVFTGAKFPAFP